MHALAEREAECTIKIYNKGGSNNYNVECTMQNAQCNGQCTMKERSKNNCEL